jgi:hypothetical protein
MWQGAPVLNPRIASCRIIARGMLVRRLQLVPCAPNGAAPDSITRPCVGSPADVQPPTSATAEPDVRRSLRPPAPRRRLGEDSTAPSDSLDTDTAASSGAGALEEPTYDQGGATAATAAAQQAPAATAGTAVNEPARAGRQSASRRKTQPARAEPPPASSSGSSSSSSSSEEEDEEDQLLEDRRRSHAEAGPK